MCGLFNNLKGEKTSRAPPGEASPYGGEPVPGVGGLIPMNMPPPSGGELMPGGFGGPTPTNMSPSNAGGPSMLTPQTAPGIGGLQTMPIGNGNGPPMPLSGGVAPPMPPGPPHQSAHPPPKGRRSRR